MLILEKMEGWFQGGIWESVVVDFFWHLLWLNNQCCLLIYWLYEHVVKLPLKTQAFLKT